MDSMVTCRSVRALSLSIGFSLLAIATSDCSGGAPAHPGLEPAADATVGDAGLVVPPGDASADAAAPAPYYGLCPDAMGPTFPSIVTQMFATASCGTNAQFDCHSTTGALSRSEGGTGSLLDFSLDAATIYAELLGDGSGEPAVNIEGDAGGLLRVAPGQPDASLLYIKLAMPTGFDPRYGLAMPPNVLPCPAVLDTVRAWIDDGAAPK